MIKKIEIENYKSVEKLAIETGRFNVFIGENGCGKTNILESIAFAWDADDLGKLSLKGVRTTEPKYFKSGFEKKSNENILFCFYDGYNNKIELSLYNAEIAYGNWERKIVINDENLYNISEKVKESTKLVGDMTESLKEKVTVGSEKYRNAESASLKSEAQTEIDLSVKNYTSAVLEFVDKMKSIKVAGNSAGELDSFIVYAPENYFLRNYNTDNPYTQPLGTKGEGLLKLVKVIKKEKPEEYKEIFESLHLIDWFSDIAISEDDLAGAEYKLSDKYLEEGIGDLDIKNANEGFFLLLFYITLFVSNYTPSFFAIDNIDTALNPKLCTKLIEVLAQLSKKHNKQVLITTHNPAILDGLNLNDPEQCLFAVSRNKLGYTKATRVEKKPPLDGEKPLKLSEQFLRGYIGGIPKNF